MLNKFVEKFKDDNLLKSKLVLAVSGGVDSMVMLDIFLNNYNGRFEELLIVHFDHGIREDSNKDFELIQQYLMDRSFNMKGLILKKLDFSTTSNFESEARLKRYNYLEEVRVNNAFDYILTAHHQDDQVETVFLNFLKGSFVPGLAGLAEKDVVRHLYRPLIDFSKKELLDYADKYNVPYLEDSTNADSKYLRNYLRNDLIPAVKTKIGSLNALARNAEFYSELSQYLDQIADNFISQNLVNSEIERVKILELPNFLRFNVYTKLLPGYPLSVADFAEIDSLVEAGVTGKFRQMGEVKFLIQKKNLIIR
jgi:tRNA(Ile)-lysidine synthetase-like protein